MEEIINNNNDKQGPCLAPMGSGLNAREAIARLCLGQRGWGGGGGGGGGGEGERWSKLHS